jgi:hypothetical protein
MRETLDHHFGYLIIALISVWDVKPSFGWERENIIAGKKNWFNAFIYFI